MTVECPEINLEEIGNLTKVKPSTPKLLFTEMTSVFDYTVKIIYRIIPII